jgi:hypothetical protein
MTSTHHAMTAVGHFLEHAAAVLIGFIMMVVGLGLGVTMVMLPVGITIGLLGFAIFVGGLFARIDE